MSTAAVLEAAAQNYDIKEIEYLRHGDKPLLARVYLPHGSGPFPALVECHGGAWCNSDRFTEALRHKYMASHGIVSIALDFRSGNTDPYPASVQDINYAVRWAKAHAKELETRPDLIGISGQSSGGHLAMLAAMRPDDARYTAIKLPAGAPTVDASLRAVAMLWPVINPLSRYRHALRARDSANPPAWVGNIPDRHDLYWKTEAAMADGNPMLMLEKGEKVPTPPALWLQGRPDPVHDYHDADSSFAGTEPERFTANYRKAGGNIELLIVDQGERTTAETLGKVAAFFHQHIPVSR